MDTISGAISRHLAALGAGTRDRVVFAILTRNPHFIEDLPVTRNNGEVWLDIANIKEGVLLQFRDGELDRVVVSIRQDEPFYPYPTPTELIKGLDLATATREDVTALLGAPQRETTDEMGHDELGYELDGPVVTLTFTGDHVLRVTTSRSHREQPGAPRPA